MPFSTPRLRKINVFGGVELNPDGLLTEIFEDGEPNYDYRLHMLHCSRTCVPSFYNFNRDVNHVESICIGKRLQTKDLTKTDDSRIRTHGKNKSVLLQEPYVLITYRYRIVYGYGRHTYTWKH